MSTVAQSPSHRSEIAELFIRDAATLMLPVRSSRFGYALYALATTNAVLFRYIQHWRLCHTLGVLANSRPGSLVLLKLVSLFCILGLLWAVPFSCN